MILDNFASSLKRYITALFGETETKRAGKSLIRLFLQIFIINLLCISGIMIGGIQSMISAQVYHAVKEEAGWQSNLQLQIWVNVQRVDGNQSREQKVTLPVQQGRFHSATVAQKENHSSSRVKITCFALDPHFLLSILPHPGLQRTKD